MTLAEDTLDKTFEVMSIYGGNFCKGLSQLYRMADPGNKLRLVICFANYVEEYGPCSAFYKRG